MALTVRRGAVAGPWVRVRIRIWVYHLAVGWLRLGLGLRFLLWRRRLGLASAVGCGAAARPPWLRAAWIWARIGAYHLTWRLLLRRFRFRIFFRWRRLGDLDVLDDLSGLAAELGGELVGVEGPRHEHLVLLVHDLLDDELPLICAVEIYP